METAQAARIRHVTTAISRAQLVLDRVHRNARAALHPTCFMAKVASQLALQATTTTSVSARSATPLAPHVMAPWLAPALRAQVTSFFSTQPVSSNARLELILLPMAHTLVLFVTAATTGPSSQPAVTAFRTLGALFGRLA